MRGLDQGVAREALLTAGAGAVVAAALAWFAPPGADLAAHMYQRTLFLEHGFSLWNNFWYAGRYSFISYSPLYYPLAALVGIRVLAVATVAVTSLAFAVLAAREWGPAARWSSRTFAVVWAGIVLTAAFPFALGIALALLALWALQADRRWRFAGLVVLTVTASPVAFLLLTVVLGAIALERGAWRRIAAPAAVVVGIGLSQLLLWRLFPAGGRYPFSAAEAAAAITFCLIGLVLTWNVESARLLRFVFLLYLIAIVAVFVVPSSVGENIARLRYLAIPITVLALSLRAWRPRPVALLVLGLAVSWNTTPLAANLAHGARDPASDEAHWRPVIAFLHAHLTPSYRVEAVDTVGHWPAVYLARADIPLSRGWFRQGDFPQNRILYGDLRRATYLSWLRRLGVRYVVVSDGPVDYSARAEKRLIDSGRSGFTAVFRTPALVVYEVPHARRIVSGPGGARVLSLRNSRMVLRVDRPGRYRVAVRYSPYWRPSIGCVERTRDGMIRLAVPRAGAVRLRFDVDAESALSVLAGGPSRACAA